MSCCCACNLGWVFKRTCCTGTQAIEHQVLCIWGPFYCTTQGRFAEQLYNSGMVDETEKEALVAPIERLERRLMRRGALGWRSPRIDEV